MHILLTNDDGLESGGLQKLYKVLCAIEGLKTTIIAPLKDKSGSSNSFTIFKPLFMQTKESNIYALSGTPVDCVKVGLNGFLKEKIDLVISGINNRANMGFDIYYSGTVGAAREGCFNGINSIALSLASKDGKGDYETASYYAINLIRKVMEGGLPKEVFLNVNIPNCGLSQIKGLKITKTGERVYKDKLIEREDPAGNRYFWFDGDSPSYSYKSGSDFQAIEEGYVSITPLQIDATAHESIKRLNYIIE